MTVTQLRDTIASGKVRSAWESGVRGYAIDLLENLDGVIPDNSRELHKKLLNGADNWRHYSYSGCAYCYDRDIAAALCTTSELKRTHYGDYRPNCSENWLDVQARALYQAEYLVYEAYKKLS